METKKPTYLSKIFTGIRPTGSLTIGNVIGAVIPLLDLQDKTGEKPLVFVADIHALTDHEPNVIKENVSKVVIDYLSLGLDPNKVDIFIQSDIKSQILELTTMLSREITIAELIRIPTLKEKLKGGKNPESANTLLAFYPILMAADILLQRSEFVPVGQDQQPHIEMTRLLARRFNKRYAEVFPLPKPQEVEQVRILSLNGEGKMSKSSPESAIFLSDTEQEISHKIKRAQTAFERDMPPILESHIIVAKALSGDSTQIEQIDALITRHMAGEKVMGEFKDLLTQIVTSYIATYQERKEQVSSNPDAIEEILSRGRELATRNADETLLMAKEAMGI